MNQVVQQKLLAERILPSNARGRASGRTCVPQGTSKRILEMLLQAVPKYGQIEVSSFPWRSLHSINVPSVTRQSQWGSAVPPILAFDKFFAFPVVTTLVVLGVDSIFLWQMHHQLRGRTSRVGGYEGTGL